MSELQQLLDHLKSIYALESKDLTLPEFARGSIYGTLDIISAIEEIELNGYPPKDEENGVTDE